MAKETETETLDSRAGGNEPIAIIGIGCRFPGNAHDPESFWKLLEAGVDAISEVPQDRWSIQRFYDPDPTKPGSAVTKWGGFISQSIELFDAQFFGMSPREAAYLDPMQRWLLEVAWESMEDAGLIAEQLAGTKTGVFIGAFYEDIKIFQLSESNRDLIGPHSATGHAMTMLANRISYSFDFQGPSVALDTACSSSLVAVHLACQSLWSGESTLALAGGVNAMFKPEFTIAESKAGMLSPDGRSKTFDSRANGYVRGEGAGIVVLKPLAQALADGDPIYALIRGSAVNQDGRTSGITVPNGAAQQALVHEVYQQAGVAPRSIQYVEAHGTGTPVGDPIEANALGSVLSLDRPADAPCLIGSVKTNIGHLEAAAGIAGLIKVALCLKHRQIPPHLHLIEPNPNISFADLGLRVPQTLEPWPEAPGPALASVNSFGFGGTNAHVVLEEAPARRLASEPANTDQPALLVPVSARSAEALHATARSYHDFLLHDPRGQATALHNLHYTAASRRSHHEHRLAVVTRSRSELIEQLEAFLADAPQPGTTSGRKQGQAPRIVFVFAGMGPQWWAMGRELLAQEPVFRATIEQIDGLLGQYADWSLLTELTADEADTRMAETQIAQPANFALQVALCALWRTWGIEPAAIVGHSAGEVAGMYLAGSLSLEQAVQVIFHRSRLQHQTTGRGKLAAVGLSLAAARVALAGYEDRVSVAAVNSPSAVTLVGDPDALAAVVAPLQEQQIFCRYLNVDVPYHSHYMDPLHAELSDVLHDLVPQSATLPLYSTVTGDRIDGREVDAEYWWRNVREPVFFAAATDQLCAAGYQLFLEIGPHPVLSNSIKECLSARLREGSTLTSLRRQTSERATMLESLGTLYTLGCPVEWPALLNAAGRHTHLPTYPWQHEHHWAETEEARADRLGAATHPLLGQRLRSAHPTWELRLDVDRLPYLDDHRIQNAVVYPGAGYIEASVASARELFGSGAYTIELEEIEFRKALFLPSGSLPKLQLTFNPQDGALSIYSKAPATQSWTLHMSANLRQQPVQAGTKRVSGDRMWASCTREVTAAACYQHFRSMGLDYGPAFQGIARLWQGTNATIAEVTLHESLLADDQGYQIHPVVLDLGFQALLANTLPDDAALEDQSAQVYMPVTVERCRVYGPLPKQIWLYAQLLKQDAHSISGSVQVCDADGVVVLELQGVRAQALGSAQSTATIPLRDTLYRLAWSQQAAPTLATNGHVAERGSWLILADAHGVGAALATHLEWQGERCVLVAPAEHYRAAEGRYWLNPQRPEDFRQLLHDAFGPEQVACRGIVHLWNLEQIAPDDLTVAALERAQDHGAITITHLIQALDQSEWRKMPKLWLVTRGAQAIDRDSADVALTQSLLWGLARVIAYEHQNMWGGIIDLSPTPATDEVAQLFAEVWHPRDTDQIALRDGQRYSPQLVREQETLAGPVTPSFRADGSYLITGGLGGLGLEVARWLVRHGARRLILMGRTALPARARWSQLAPDDAGAQQIAAIRELEALGATVHLAAVDVADAAQLGTFLETYQHEGWPLIRGVIHAAGVIRDRTILQLDAATFDLVFKPKVAGAWHLHTLLRDAPLDFFVLFSSVASMLGSPSQGNYASANAFLDALAQHRRAQSLPAVSINWGPWAEVGMAARLLEQGGRLGFRGLHSITPPQGLEALAHVMRQGAAQVGVIPIDWPDWFDAYPAAQTAPFFAQIQTTEDNGTASDERSSQTERLSSAALLALDLPARRQALETYLCEQVARALRLPLATLDTQQPISSLGLDSLIAVELKNRIEVDLGSTLSVVTLLEGAAIEHLAGQLLERIGAEPAPAVIPVATLSAPGLLAADDEQEDVDDLLANLDALSDADLDRLLDKML